MSPCPTRACLDAWILDDMRDTGVAAHVAACPRCARRAESVRADGELLRDLRDAVRSRADEPPAAPIPGYRIEAELRRGGQGVVHRAVQLSTQRAVALKVLAAGPHATARERVRFEREIELASRLRHPFIVTVFDSGTADGTPWYAMELVDGVPVDEWVRAAHRTLRARLELFARIAGAVACAHRRGVIHRDLKPSNVLVDREDRPRVLDFGAACETAPAELLRVTAPGEFLGTLAYAAPEQLRGAPGDVDTRTDVYALGLMLYEVVAGRSPFPPATSLADVVDRARHHAVEPPSRHAPGSDRDLDAIVLRALEHDPAARYGSAEALEADIARHLEGAPVDARAHDGWYVARRLLARHKRRIAAALAVGAAGLALVAAWWNERTTRAHQREQVALVRSVFQELLADDVPQPMGADARLLEVFGLAARGIDAALGDTRDVQAEVQLVVGDTYRRLLRPVEAEKHLRAALARFRAVDDRRQLEVARCANLLGLALCASNSPEAIPVQEEALAIRERELAPADPVVAESRRGLAVALLAQFRDVDEDRARLLLERALADQRAAYGDDHPEVAETKLWRAQIRGDLTVLEVERMLSEASATFVRHGTNDSRAIGVFTAYARLLQELGRFDAAREELDRAIALARASFGEELAPEMIRNVARLEFARGDIEAAEQLSRRAIACELERWADRRPDEARRLRALAARVEQPGSPNAEPPYAEAFAELRRFHGEGSFEIADWINGVALTLHAQGRTAAMEPLLRESLRIRCRAMGADCPVRRRTIEMLAGALLAEHRGAEAVGLLEESVATYARLDEKESEPARRAAELLATCRAAPEPGRPPAR